MIVDWLNHFVMDVCAEFGDAAVSTYSPGLTALSTPSTAYATLTDDARPGNTFASLQRQICVEIGLNDLLLNIII